MSNANYGGGSASTQAARGLAYAVELQASQTFQQLISTNVPLLALLKNRGGLSFNTDSKLGPKVLTPVFIGASANPVVGVTRANQNAATTLDQSEGTQAEFVVAHYRGGYIITAADEELYSGKDTMKRASLVAGRADHLSEQWKIKMCTDMGTDSTDAENKLMGYMFPINAANVVGNINQATGSNARWRGQVTSSVGTLTKAHIDTMFVKLQNVNSRPDLLLCSSSSSGADIFNIVRGYMDANSYFQAGNAGKVEYGFDTYVYRGALVAHDQYAPAGEMYLLDTSTYFFQGSMSPKTHHTMAIAGTDSTEVVQSMFCCLGNKNPQKNGKLVGITG